MVVVYREMWYCEKNLLFVGGSMRELNIKDDFEEYLSASKYINWKDKRIIAKANEFMKKI